MTRRERRQAYQRKRWLWRIAVIGTSVQVFVVLDYLGKHFANAACTLQPCGVRPTPAIVAILHCIVFWRYYE